MSRNFTADVDTQREYFNATYFNNSGTIQQAKYQTSLLKPFFNDPDKWKLAINRMRIPLSGIPLTRNNIPFEQWQVGLQYNSSSSVIGGQRIEYVKQYNENTQNLYLSVSINNNLEWEIWNMTPSSASQITAILNPIPMLDATSSNGFGTFVSPQMSPDNLQISVAISASNSTKFNIYNTLQESPLQTVNLGVLGVIKILGFTLTEDLKVFVAVELSSGGFRVFQYNPNGSNTQWTYSIGYDTPVGDGPFSNLTSISYALAGGYFIATYTLPSGGNQTLKVYKGQIGVSATMSLLGTGNTSSNASYFPCAIMNGNNFILVVDYNSAGVGELVVYDTSFIVQATFANFNLLNNQNYLLGYNHYGYLLSNSSYNGSSMGLNLFAAGNRLTYFNPTDGSMSLASYSGTTVVHFPGGAYDIFTYQEFLNKINSAFEYAFDVLRAQLGALFLPTQPPSVVYNAQDKLFSLIVEGQYLTKNPDGSNQYNVFMNEALWDKFYFPSFDLVISGTTYQSILMQNYGINAIQGNGSSSLPQFIYVQQEDTTIYAFYDLVRIIVGTTRIPVSGDGEGKTFSNSGSVSNSSVNMITDIVPDTTTLTPGSVLIYVPAGILRWYNLYAQQPFDKIDLYLQYETKDGNIYPIDVINGEFFSVKLEFKKGPGDF